MGDVRGHVLHRPVAANLQKLLLARGIELKQRGAELKTLCPLGPAARGVFAFHREDGSAQLRLPGFLDAQNLLGRKLKEPLDLGNEFLRGQPRVDFEGHTVTINRDAGLFAGSYRGAKGQTHFVFSRPDRASQKPAPRAATPYASRRSVRRPDTSGPVDRHRGDWF